MTKSLSKIVVAPSTVIAILLHFGNNNRKDGFIKEHFVIMFLYKERFSVILPMEETLEFKIIFKF